MTYKDATNLKVDFFEILKSKKVDLSDLTTNNWWQRPLFRFVIRNMSESGNKMILRNKNDL